MPTRWTRVRIVLCGLVLLGLGSQVGRRALQLQIREAVQLREWADNNYLREVEIAPRRGRILDRRGAELASTADLDSVFCNPRQLVADAVPRLAKAVHLDPRELDKTLSTRKSQYFAWVKRRVSPQESAAALALGLLGVSVRKEPRRVYPNGELASTVIGHAGLDGRGLEGVELQYDEALRGTGMEVTGMRDRLGRDLLMEGTVDASASAGKDLVLTLDKYLTYLTERALEEAVSKHGAKAATSVMLDPHTGEILAMASVPGYNPNSPSDGAERGARNRAITDAYEPGSIMKTVTFSAAFDAGKLKPEDRFDCQLGQLQVGKYHIRDDHPKGVLTAAEVYKYSSNIGTVKIARRIGKETLARAIDRLGFGRPTGVGLPGERRGTVRPVSRWGEIELATQAFGQGLTVTPLQMASAYAAIASGGIYHPPKLAVRFVTADGHSEPVPRPADARPEARVLSESTARTMLTIMQGVTEDGTAKLAAIPGYPVAGKTGTAQKVSNGRYDPSKYLAAFVGIVPADNPRVVIAVMIDEPHGVHYGGLVAAPVFKEIAEATLRYLGVPPSTSVVASTARPAKQGGTKIGTVRRDEADTSEVEGLGVDQPVASVGEAQDEDGPEVASSEEQAELAMDGPPTAERNLDAAIPDFVGMTLGQAVRAARRAGVELVPEGSGIAATQTPGPGPGVRGIPCRVSFRSGG
ncbi:MAG TPA: penicillin-binding transpeptidase domain-containing protein [Polyangia bacterium]|jgi:Cell division protein FtsI/penicillin-binding protein 2|nr:penicillin-binding transpeptidase domain-containing protein [Polyangia bacterium]